MYKLIWKNFCSLLLKKNPSEFLAKQQGKSNEQPAKSNEQPAKSNEQPAKSNEQPAKVTSNEQKVTSHEQKLTSNEQRGKSFTSIKDDMFSLLPENSCAALAFLRIKLNGINVKTNTKGDKESP